MKADRLSRPNGCEIDGNGSDRRPIARTSNGADIGVAPLEAPCEIVEAGREISNNFASLGLRHHPFLLSYVQHRSDCRTGSVSEEKFRVLNILQDCAQRSRAPVFGRLIAASTSSRSFAGLRRFLGSRVVRKPA